MSDWKVDPGECACTIWEWWKPIVGTFPFHALALRLVVLAQLSSCFVERVFLRLKMRRDVCGDNMKEDMNEIRIFLQYNGDLSEILSNTCEDN